MLGMLSVFTGSMNFIQASAPTVINDEYVYKKMSGISRYIYEALGSIDESTGEVSYSVAGFTLLALIFILSAIVFKLGFAKTLPLWQNAVIYGFLFLGCIMLTFFAFFLPIVEGLMVAALILVVYKIRLWREKHDESSNAI